MKRKSILEMKCYEVKKIFMKPESYFTSDLPPYVNFEEALSTADKILTTKKNKAKKLGDVCEGGKLKEIRETDDVNYILQINKGSPYSWRPISIIHPVLYADLVNIITKEDHWSKLTENFKKRYNESVVECVSLPVESVGQKSDKAEQILSWWETVEQKQIAS